MLRRTRARVTSWLASRGASYTQAVVALALNIPFMVAALGRYPQDLTWASLEGGYALLVFAGYYVFAVFLVVTAAFLLTGAWRRVFLGASTALLALTLYYLIVDGIVYRVTKMHIDAFWIQYLVTTFRGLGIGSAQIGGAVLLLAVILALEVFLVRKAGQITHRARWSAGLAALCLTSFVVTQTVHIAAYEANDTRFTWLSPQLPFYFPVVSYQNAVKYGSHLSMIRELEADEPLSTGEALHYPLGDPGCRSGSAGPHKNVLILFVESWRADAMDSVVTPRLHAFSKDASLFLDHFSSGNSTRSGVFPLFYGIHSTYWTAVKANNVRIHNPVLIDALQDNGYAFGIFAKSNFKRHKIKDAVFRDIDIQESFAGTTKDANDRDMTERLFAFMAQQHASHKPFFGFAFYKSTHYSYDYPADSAPFQPTAELNAILASKSDDPTPVLNDYRNSVHYVDGLIGHLLERMRAAGMLENTIVVITSDHGEEFNDNRDNSWMHGGDFTRYLTRVPLIIYEPGKAGRRVSAVTSEVDIAPTVLQEGLQCGWNARDYSNGLNLFGPLPERRPVVVASYAYHAMILDDNVFVTMPWSVERYDLNGRKTTAAWPDAAMMQQAVDEMTRFYVPSSTGLAASPKKQEAKAIPSHAGR
ncbi:MAG TPA: sulfatase-like hydrolase/transferase [Gemmatimonadaceae bacterium]|nr:sulfatase-like hydrolase/transferase [Gemmatimonadaceae bacterium]